MMEVGLKMVLIAAAVCTKAGKVIFSRQFVEMTKARIEGLLSAFPKLMSSGKQHTFVETESVRYVYQPLDRLYMLLITTKASNILEDLETLRLFSRVIPEYCHSMDEAEILDNSFNLIFAFDEIVALGYRESVNLAQIRTFVEMDSHEEKVYQAVRQTQEREAKNKMREKAKELHRQKMENAKRGIKGTGSFGGSGGFGANNSLSAIGGGSNFKSGPESSSVSSDVPRSSYTPLSKPSMPTKAMKLTNKGRDVESFVESLKSEGENVAAAANKTSSSTQKISAPPPENTDLIHLRLEERMVVEVGRDGGVRNLEVQGLASLRISDEKFGRVRICVDNKDQRGIQLQTHPNVDKELFKIKSQIGMKNPAKPFPISTDVGVLKWRFHSTDESSVPLSINCWPSENGQGGCDVNIEYELEHTHLELNEVCITIPLPIGCNPVVAECDGEYNHDSRKNVLTWSMPILDASNKSGSMEFAAPNSNPDDFFPLQVNFVSKQSYAHLKITEVLNVDDDSPAKFSSDTGLFTSKYEIV